MSKKEEVVSMVSFFLVLLCVSLLLNLPEILRTTFSRHSDKCCMCVVSFSLCNRLRRAGHLPKVAQLMRGLEPIKARSVLLSTHHPVTAKKKKKSPWPVQGQLSYFVKLLLGIVLIRQFPEKRQETEPASVGGFR